MKFIGYVYGNKRGWFAHRINGAIYMKVGFNDGLMIRYQEEDARAEIEHIQAIYEDAKLIKIGEVK